MNPKTRKELQKQLISIKLCHPWFKYDYYSIPYMFQPDTPEHYMKLFETLDWVLRHAFFDMIIDKQVNCETYMILYIDFETAIKVLKYIAGFSDNVVETLVHIIECERFFMEHNSFATTIERKCVNEYLKKRIVFQNYKVNISDKELFDKWIHQALGSTL